MKLKNINLFYNLTRFILFLYVITFIESVLSPIRSYTVPRYEINSRKRFQLFINY